MKHRISDHTTVNVYECAALLGVSLNDVRALLDEKTLHTFGGDRIAIADIERLIVQREDRTPR